MQSERKENKREVKINICIRGRKNREKWLSVKKQLSDIGENSNDICDSLLQLIPERKLKTWHQIPKIGRETDKDIETVPLVI